ncbi:hypothetical protein LZ554_009213 [Drepanopeziza brunnea f. sp. 'monogermtubi']|nr:hypothetical protein LZ554_009213 [Drepanopeziza brunnea f. sp. 'monogermtubi']
MKSARGLPGFAQESSLLFLERSESSYWINIISRLWNHYELGFLTIELGHRMIGLSAPTQLMVQESHTHYLFANIMDKISYQAKLDRDKHIRKLAALHRTKSHYTVFCNEGCNQSDNTAIPL